uniref:CTLH domain-containing protein n=1 Tax=Anopheles epiroticus TaxID=199890 RepID=A0A182P295_9DIPT
MSCNDKNDGISKEEWQSRLETFPFKQDDINKLIMNYLVTEGFKEAAEKFQAESGVVPSVDLNSLDNRIQIREAVQNGFIQEATHLVNQLHPELLDNDRYLYFHLQQLHLIELIRNPEVLNELERTLALLAFEKPQNSPFADLLDHTHRQKVASELNAAILKMEQQEQSNPRVINILKLILWAQTELDKKNVKYPKMMDLASASIEPK